MPHAPRPSAAHRRLRAWAAVLLLMTVISVLWTAVPVPDWIEPRLLLARLKGLSEHPAAPWVVVAAFLVGGLLVLPVTLMVIVTVITFGTVEGFVYALGGATMSAVLSFLIGRAAGHRQVKWLAGSRVHRVSKALGNAGVVSVATMRMLPVTHFTVVSLIAGASHIRLRDFVAGTVIGMAPGIAAIALFFDRFSALTQEPTLRQVLIFVAVSAAILGSLLVARRLARRR